MQSILIGIAVLVVCICALLYYKLKKVNQEVLRLNKKLESITASKAEVNLANNPPTTESVNNIKTEYDNYVQSNNFENVFEEEPISDEIKKEIDELTESALNGENLVESQVYEDAQEEDPLLEETQVVEEDVIQSFEQEEQPVDLDLDDLEQAHISPSNDDTFQVSNEDDLGEGVEVLGEGVEVLGEGEEVLGEGVEVLGEGEGEKVLGEGEGEELLGDGEGEEVETNQIEVNLYNNLPSTEQLLENAINENNYTLEDINQMSVKQLQSLARKNKLKIKGRKTELIERLATLYNLNNNMK